MIRESKSLIGNGGGGGGECSRALVICVCLMFVVVDNVLWTQATVGGSPFGPFISVARGHSRE